MNNEETLYMQPKPQAEAAKPKPTSTSTPKKEDTPSTLKGAAAATAAGVFGGAVGGAGSVAAANALNSTDEEEIEVVETQDEPLVAESKPQPAAAKVETIAETDETDEMDYSNHNGADPVVEEEASTEPEAIPASNPENEVQVLGVYERTTDDGTYQEMAILTNGDEVAVVLDADGDGEADVLGVDLDHSGDLDEGEVCDISDQHVSMSQYEEAYIAQQQMEMEEQETFSYVAEDTTDYDNDVDFCEA